MSSIFERINTDLHEIWAFNHFSVPDLWEGSAVPVENTFDCIEESIAILEYKVWQNSEPGIHTFVECKCKRAAYRSRAEACNLCLNEVILKLRCLSADWRKLPRPTTNAVELKDSYEKVYRCLQQSRACLLGLQPDEPSPLARQMGKMIGEINQVMNSVPEPV
jgi:hypothetical protein